MSEVIREFIKGNERLGEAEAFERFLDEDRIRTWVGDNAQRREKLHREFARLWASHHAHLGEDHTVVEVRSEPKRPPSEPTRPEAGTRRLSVMCPSCNALDVWTKGRIIECRHCNRHYENMLDLIPVRPVGPFTFIFGEGTGGVVTAVALVTLLLIIYGVFRWG